jgi:hypothetical protein
METYLLETEVSGSLTEALSANVEGVLPDDGVTVAANAAKEDNMNQSLRINNIPLATTSSVVLWVSVPQICHID